MNACLDHSLGQLAALADTLPPPEEYPFDCIPPTAEHLITLVMNEYGEDYETCLQWLIDAQFHSLKKDK